MPDGVLKKALTGTPDPKPAPQGGTLSQMFGRAAPEESAEPPKGDLVTKATIAGLKAMETLRPAWEFIQHQLDPSYSGMKAPLVGVKGPAGVVAQQAPVDVAVVPDYIGGPASRTKWAVVSGANPAGKQLTAEENIPFVRKAESVLRKFLGGDYIPTTGQYPSSQTGQLITGEPSFLIPNIAEQDARALGHAFQQEGVLTKRGFVNDVGTYHPSSGVREAGSNDLAFFELPDKTRIVSDVDWGRVKELPTTKLTHYSQNLGGDIGDEVIVKPEFMGTGKAGAEVRRTDRMPMSHFYMRGATPEREFANMPMYVGETSRPIYDIASDPMNVLGTMSKGGTRGIDVDELERVLTQKLGYTGFKNSDISPDIVKIAEDVMMKRKR